MNATQNLSVLNSPIWVHSMQIPLHETQISTQLNLSILKTWLDNFSTQITTQIRNKADELGLLLSLSELNWVEIWVVFIQLALNPTVVC